VTGGPDNPDPAHNPQVAGSNPAPATMNDEGLAAAAAANPFPLPRNWFSVGPLRLWLHAEVSAALSFWTCAQAPASFLRLLHRHGQRRPFRPDLEQDEL